MSRHRRDPVGYEIVERYDDGDVRASIELWAGDYNRQIIRDRQTGRPASRRAIARVFPSVRSVGGYAYTYTAGAKAGWRHGWAESYEAALADVGRWVQRRFERLPTAGGERGK